VALEAPANKKDTKATSRDKVRGSAKKKGGVQRGGGRQGFQKKTLGNDRFFDRARSHSTREGNSGRREGEKNRGKCLDLQAKITKKKMGLVGFLFFFFFVYVVFFFCFFLFFIYIVCLLFLLFFGGILSVFFFFIFVFLNLLVS